jgi:hypothetical protein
MSWSRKKKPTDSDRIDARGTRLLMKNQEHSCTIAALIKPISASVNAKWLKPDTSRADQPF